MIVEIKNKLNRRKPCQVVQESDYRFSKLNHQINQIEEQRQMELMKPKIMISYIVLFSFLFISGCVIVLYSAKYNIGLKEVERPAQAKERYGEKTITKVQEKEIYKYYFEDELVKFIWSPGAREISFVIFNKTEHSIQIIWDEASYVDANGMSHRIMHSGIKYNERNNPQPPSILVRRGTMNDIIVPTDYIHFYELFGIGWSIEPFFPIRPECWEEYGHFGTGETKEVFSERTKKYIGKTFQILLPLKIEDVVNEYIFIFEIENVIVD